MSRQIIPNVSTDEQSQFKQNLAIQALNRSLSGSREILTENRTYYVRADGSDSNNGLSDAAGGSFLTINHAIDIIISTLDVAGYTVTIQWASASSYTSQVSIPSAWTGGGGIIIDGNSQSISTSGHCFNFGNVSWLGTVTLQNWTITSSGASGINNTSRGTVNIGEGIVFGDCNDAHIVSSGAGSYITATDYEIAGDAQWHYVAFHRGFVQIDFIEITLTGTPNFSQQFARSDTSSEIELIADTFTGSATGVRYAALRGGIINTNGAGATYLPGDSAGTGTDFSASPWGLYE